MDNIHEIIEENFCLKFELDSLADHMLFGKHERWVHGFMNKYGDELHVKRYEFAKNHISGKRVLDIAGGSGYGTYYLAENGNPLEIHSVDLSEDSVRYAKHRYPNEKITRFVDNAETYENKDYYDVVVSFETIEHLPGYEEFLKRIVASLKPGGKLIISTPVTSITSKDNINQFHVIEWSFDDFHTLIKKHFKIDEVYTQNIFMESDIADTFIKKIRFKLNPKKFHYFDADLKPFKNDINLKKINSGFQLLVCTKE
ncbi:class I SAM-dependent methyltransferase [Fluviicola sp.]|uniref:class I SAM-dependent methyltransferase n=1 Tax=Fluviicola sp. TaxID=1917219 RepID=UPI003D2D20DD